MDSRSASPTRPRILSLREVDLPSTSPSPASESENKRWADDVEEYDEIKEYIDEVDELLDFLKPFPRDQDAHVEMEPPKPGLDHLENLIRLVEHLKDLKERNAQSRQKTQYLKDLKILRDERRKLILHEEDTPAEPPEMSKKPRPSIPFRKSNRSKSLSTNEYDKMMRNVHFFPPTKAKVSKWTKVKEAFRWEKAANLDSRQKHNKPSTSRSQCLTIPKATGVSGNFLQLPADSPSPADSVLSGQISSGTSTSCILVSSGYSGEHSSTAHSSSSVHLLDLPSPPPHPLYEDDSISLSSSDDEKAEESADLAKDSTIDFPIQDDPETRRSKSLDGGTVLGPNSHFLQNFSKESLHEGGKSLKPHKTPWGKVKDIIHTRRGSLKKKVKKREEFKAEAEAFSAALDIPSPDDAPTDTRPSFEITPCERTAQLITLPVPQRLEGSIVRPFTPVLTLTLPSSEELQKLSAAENQDSKGPWSANPDDEAFRLSDSQLFDERSKAQGLSSRWGKVKRAFLTSGSNEEPSSAPSSPLHIGSFFSDIESDELSSGEWMEQDKKIDLLSLKSEVQHTFTELQRKLCQELDANVADCEMLKAAKLDEKKCEESDHIPRKPRESLTIPLPTVDDLSPEFKKKLDEWKKIKKTPNSPTSAKEEVQSHFMTRIGEWQRWRPGSHKGEIPFKQEHHLHEEFCKKLEEWQMLKSTKRRSRSQSDRGKDEMADNQTSSPNLSRKNSKKAVKKVATSGKSSAAESLTGSLKEKEGRAGRKTQREKDLQWLDKELHKIEREKLRLEREREKYLEREARLEQMKRTMDSTSPKQEVLIQTATGFFRFEGISQKFTKKLYEWEKARGIAPEASTIALLETANVAGKGAAREERSLLHRSKSFGSVIDTGSIMAQSIAQHPSSLSLNDVDDLEALEQAALLDASRASSEPIFKEDDEPEALIVDVEDVEEETAAPMAEAQIQTHVPVYSYAPDEVTQLIDSSGSDCEKDLQVFEVKPIVRKSSEEKASLIDHNINLLELLEVKEAICREIENDIGNIEGQISQENDCVSSSPREILLREGENLKHSFLEHCEQQEGLAHDLVDNMSLLHAAHVSSPESEENNVGQVMELSSQLLTLAKKLEGALNKRNADVNNIRTNIVRRQKVNKVGRNKAWYSIDETSVHDYSGGSKDWLDDDVEVDELPSLITKKVLELKQGLSSLKIATEKEAAEQVFDTPDNTATFTFHVPKNQRSKGSSEERSPNATRKKRLSLKIASSEKPEAENLSPVTVNVSPTFWTNLSSEPSQCSTRNLEKSKVQELYSEDAEEVFDLNIKCVDKTKERKNSDVLKRKIKEKISEMQRIASDSRVKGVQQLQGGVDSNTEFKVSLEDNEDKVVIVGKKNGRDPKSKKNLKARRITDTTIAYSTRGHSTSSSQDDNDDVFLTDSDVISPRSYNFSEETQCEISPDLNVTTPAFVFVPTTRKIISPVQRDTSSSIISYVIDEIEPKETPKEGSANISLPTAQASFEKDLVKQSKSAESFPLERKKSIGFFPEAKQGGDIGIPPLPNSPSLSRKLSSAPSIRMMIAKYNQKICEQQESTENTGKASSPVPWRSPVLERRIKEQLEKFQQDGSNALKHGGKFERREVQKSASAGVIQGQDICGSVSSLSKIQDIGPNSALKGILKSSSTGTMRTPTALEKYKSSSNEKMAVQKIIPVTQPALESERSGPSLIRALKIKQAKAEFLSRGPNEQTYTVELPTPSPSIASTSYSWSYTTGEGTSRKDASKNRYSHVSVGSESSYEEASYSEDIPGLTKSVSTGMIDTSRGDISRRKSDSNVEETCVKKIIGHSLTETNVPSKGNSKFGISSIKSRFRKVKMRRTKEKESAVSTLCRQSLFLDFGQQSDISRLPQSSPSKSCPSSPVLDRGRQKTDDGKRWIKNTAKLFKGKECKTVPGSDPTSKKTL